VGANAPAVPSKKPPVSAEGPWVPRSKQPKKAPAKGAPTPEELAATPLSDVPLSSLPGELAARGGELTPGQIAEYMRTHPMAMPLAGAGAGYLMSGDNENPLGNMALGGLGGYLGRGMV